MTLTNSSPELLPEREQDAPLVEALIARAFGPGRFVKTAERLREGNRPLLDLSFVAWRDGRAVGCVRLWPILIGETPALLLGPFAVEEEFRGQGLGAALIVRACEAAASASHQWMLLVGDAEFFVPLGFSRAAGVTLPGPVGTRRVLLRPLSDETDAAPTGLVSVPD